MRKEMSASTTAYRLRVMNGSNSRIYKLAWSDGSPLKIIGSDGGILPSAIERAEVYIAPSERMELWVDFSDKNIGDSVQLISKQVYRNDPGFTLMNFKIENSVSVDSTLSPRLREYRKIQIEEAVNKDDPKVLKFYPVRGLGWTLNGKIFSMDESDIEPYERAKAGTTELWHLDNSSDGMSMPHPFHIHNARVQVLSRQSQYEGTMDEGWQDSILLLPGDKVEVLIKFGEDPGLFLYHCHNLEHEDMGMMRNFVIEP